MMPHGRKWQVGGPNMHKALGRSQLSKNDTGALKQNSLNALDRATSHDATGHTQPNNATREKTENGPLECAQGTWAVTTKQN